MQGTALYGASSGGSTLMANTQLASEFGTDEIQNIVVHMPDVKTDQNRWDRSCSKVNRTFPGVRQENFKSFNLIAS